MSKNKPGVIRPVIMGNLRCCLRVLDSVTYGSTLPSSSTSAVLYLAILTRRGEALGIEPKSVIRHAESVSDWENEAFGQIARFCPHPVPRYAST